MSLILIRSSEKEVNQIPGPESGFARLQTGLLKNVGWLVNPIGSVSIWPGSPTFIWLPDSDQGHLIKSRPARALRNRLRSQKSVNESKVA
jgi:hypothetical protein